MIGIQLIGVLFGIVMMYFTFLHYKKKHFSMAGFSAWMLIWAAFLFAALFSETLTFLLQPLVVYRMMDLLTITAFMVSFTLIFVLYTKTKENEQNVRKIVKKLALKVN
jgi:hypothetical protein